MSGSEQSRDTPHICLNSGQYDVFSDENVSDLNPIPSEHGGRPLTPRLVESTSTGTLQTVYTSYNANESTERLIPPRPQPQPQQETRDDVVSPNLSFQSSRRTSWSSGAGSFDTKSYSRPYALSRTDSEENDVNTQTVTEKYNVMPMDGLLLFPEDVEKDDYLHNPDPSDRERECDIWNRRGVVNVGGLAFLTLGFLVLFIGYPVMYVLSFCYVMRLTLAGLR